eukprot:1967222-Prymnesium_polylepis.1
MSCLREHPKDHPPLALAPYIRGQTRSVRFTSIRTSPSPLEYIYYRINSCGSLGASDSDPIYFAPSVHVARRQTSRVQTVHVTVWRRPRKRWFS